MSSQCSSLTMSVLYTSSSWRFANQSTACRPWVPGCEIQHHLPCTVLPLAPAGGAGLKDKAGEMSSSNIRALIQVRACLSACEALLVRVLIDRLYPTHSWSKHWGKSSAGKVDAFHECMPAGYMPPLYRRPCPNTARCSPSSRYTSRYGREKHTLPSSAAKSRCSGLNARRQPWQLGTSEPLSCSHAFVT
jgi:hypothetical protein